MITWSYGGGVQSAAIAVLVLQGRLPTPDITVIADTSREMSATWEYMDNVVQPALTKIGVQIVVASHEFSRIDLVDTGNKFVIPAFTWSEEKNRSSKMPTYCSSEWKRETVKRCLRVLGVKETDMWLGISIDEVERMKPSRALWINHVYPLVEIVPLHRQECLWLVEQYGWPTPPKSRCWMCPNQGNSSWNEIREQYPEEFKKAVQLENEIRLVNPDIYLHSSLKPLNEAIGGESSDMSDSCDSGYCFT